PDLDGLEVLRAAERLEVRPDIIITTGHATAESTLTAVECGAAGYLVKPIDLSRLSALVERLVERRRGARAREQFQADEQRHAEERVRKLRSLSTLTRFITSARDSEQVFRAGAEAATALLGAKMARVWVDDPAQRVLRVRGSFGIDPAFEQPLTEFPAIAYGEGQVGRTLEARGPIYVLDVLEDPRWKNRKLAEAAGLRASATIPMVTADRVVGVLSILFSDRREFSSEEKELMALLADQAAIAIDQARLSEEVHAQRNRLAQIFESTTDGIMFVGRDGRIEAVNGRVFELLALAEAEVIGADLVPLLARYSGDMADDLFEASLRSLIHESDGGEGDLSLPALKRVVHWVAQPTGDASGNRVGLTLTLLDVTKEREVSQMKTDFVSFVTHQLRTPLSGIKWMLELAAQEVARPGEATSYVRDAHAAAERLITLVNDLLDISRLERGKLEIHLQPADVAALTRRVLDEVTGLVQEQGHRVSFDVEDGLPAVVVDPQLLRQVMLNLVSNAVKYTPAAGQIAIRLRRVDEGVRWEIRDTGIGIPREAQRRLFEKFYRADNVYAVETEGTGLGLYLVRLILEQFGGRVWCESEEGQGATFLFTLPASE
ncbi:MAG: GAF domain-containing protein, partial [Candidatus Rokubacteria bacterium]|nr:GAF domain-containing protein [Candidatus Rokubacteria bacterium]